MIKCETSKPTHNATTRTLALDRNNFAKSRQMWIQAAYDLKFRNDDHAFQELVQTELCNNCKNYYEKCNIKTT